MRGVHCVQPLGRSSGKAASVGSSHLTQSKIQWFIFWQWTIGLLGLWSLDSVNSVELIALREGRRVSWNHPRADILTEPEWQTESAKEKLQVCVGSKSAARGKGLGPLSLGYPPSEVSNNGKLNWPCRSLQGPFLFLFFLLPLLKMSKIHGHADKYCLTFDKSICSPSPVSPFPRNCFDIQMGTSIFWFCDFWFECVRSVSWLLRWRPLLSNL